ncbi:MAG: MarR family transcriptional regulator [Eubacterium sp.]|nr:MarR family transcriptional regulator [Eubacterium sp.]
MRRKIDAFSSRKNFSGSQGRVLHFLLAQQGDIFQKDIEEEYSIRPPTATELLKKMEKNGLIHREAMADDARLKRIILDEKALQYKDVVLADITNLEEELTAGIAEEDLDVFFRVIEKMMANIS